MRPRPSNCSDRCQTMRYELSRAAKRRMVRARMPCPTGIKTQRSRFDAPRGFQPPRRRFNDGIAQRAVIPGRRRAGRSSWTLRPGMIYRRAGNGVLLAGAKYQGYARRRKEAARPWSRRHVRGPAPVARPFVQVRTRVARACRAEPHARRADHGKVYRSLP